MLKQLSKAHGNRKSTNTFDFSILRTHPTGVASVVKNEGILEQYSI